MTKSGRASPWIVAWLAASAWASAGCKDLEPETGDPIASCVDADSDPSRTVDFKLQIRPLLSGLVPGTAGCKGCHYESTGSHAGIIATGLNLEKLQTLRNGGRNTPPGVIVVPGKPCSSALVKKLQGTWVGARMPKNGPYWNTTSMQLLIDWIAEGAQGEDE